MSGGLHLFDLFLSSAGGGADGARHDAPPADVERLARVAEQLAAAALNELAGIRALDACLAPASPSDFDRQAASLLRGMYEQWSRDVDAVLDRARQVRQVAGRTVARTGELADEQGRVLAMLTASPQEVEDSRRAFRQGRTYTAEEVRRELRPGV